MKTRETQNNSAVSNQMSVISYSYDSSGNMTNATGNGQSWALGYDEDNRTTSLCYKLGALCDKMITNRYDALGRRISRADKNGTTGYVLLLTGGMERILCDLDGSGNVTAWYVHGRDLCYKVSATNGLTCYHADAMANIIALTDGHTNLVAQYAYTPHGRCLGSTNFQPQISNPYLFVGSQGVMNEFPDFAGLPLDPGLYFMRARYYSSDAGVFLSTDPVKKIGPGFLPTAYVYSGLNPLANMDAQGASFVNTLLNSGVTYSAGDTGGAGLSVSGAISRDGTEPFKVRPNLGVALYASESVEVIGFYGGKRSDWSNPDTIGTLDLSLKIMGGLGVTLSHTDAGQWGRTRIQRDLHALSRRSRSVNRTGTVQEPNNSSY
jgi:RHS repeat-associated protein